MAVNLGNVDTMMAAGKKPWHGQGTMVKEAPGVQDALKMANLDWKVKSTPLFYFNGNEMVEASNTIANYREDTGDYLGAVTDKYKIVQNEDAFAFVDAILDMGAKIETAGALDGGKRVWILAQLEPYQLLGDTIEKYLFFCNSFDGKGALKVGRTDVRVVCENTFNAAKKGLIRSWSMKHMGVDMKSRMFEATAAIGLSNAYQKALELEAEAMAIKHISAPQFDTFLDNLWTIDKDSSKLVQSRIDENKEALRIAYGKDDLGNIRGTAWGVWQAVADVAYHKEPARKTSTYGQTLMGYAMDGHPLLDKAKELLDAVK